jgi:hypothetical protein
MENEKKPKKKIWGKLGEACVEIFGELLAMLILFAIGVGVLYVIKGNFNPADWDVELIVLLGMLVVLALLGIGFAIGAIVKNITKKKKK